MIDLGKVQKEIYQNKVDKGFNVTDINKEFCLTYGEVSEAYDSAGGGIRQAAIFCPRHLQDIRNRCIITRL